MTDHRSPAGARPRMGRRIGNWQYERGLGWRLDDSDLVLDYDRLDGSGDLLGCYVLSRVPRDGSREGWKQEPIDHYLSTAMEYVENHVGELDV